MTSLDPLVPGLIVLGLLTAALGVSALRERSTPGALPFTVLTFGVTVWEFGYAFQLATSDAARSLLWVEVQWVAVVVIPVAWLVFALEYTGHDRWVTPGSVGVLALEPVVMVGLVATAGHHDLMRVTAVDATTVWGALGGPAFFYHLVYSYVLLFLGTAVLIQLLRTTPEVYGDTTTALVVGVGVPWGANMAYWLSLAPAGIDLTVVGFAVSGITFGWVLFQRRLLDVLPVTPAVAHKELVDEMNDGVVTVDASGRIIDYNSSAERLLYSGEGDDADGGFDVFATDEVAGSPVRAALPPAAAPVVERAIEGERPPTKEVVLSTSDSKRYFEVQAEPLHRQSERPVGALVTLHDIHDRVLREQRLNVLNRVLRHNVRTQANLVFGHADRIRSAATSEGKDLETVVERTDKLAECALKLERWSAQARDIETMLEDDGEDRSAIDLVPIVEEVVAELRRAHPEAEITTTLPDRATATAHESLSEAITELLENAIQHNDERPHVDVELEVTGDGVEIAVVDDGPGIPEEERRVLDRETETDLNHGSGLGLWLVNWAVRASGGELDLDTDRSRGSEVRIDLPRASGV